MDKPLDALVIVCQQCGNYPLVTTPKKESVVSSLYDIMYYLGQGMSLKQIEMTEAEREKILACECEW